MHCFRCFVRNPDGWWGWGRGSKASSGQELKYQTADTVRVNKLIFRTQTHSSYSCSTKVSPGRNAIYANSALPIDSAICNITVHLPELVLVYSFLWVFFTLILCCQKHTAGEIRASDEI